MSWVWIVGTAIGVMLAIILSQWFFIVRYERSRAATLAHLKTLEAERKYLEEILNRPEDEQIRILLRHRASLLGRLMIGEISGDGSGNEKVMQEIAELVQDRDNFMRQNRLLYENWQPGMVGKLRESGLTDKEIEICCLYALGLNGKAIQQYTQDGRHYQNVGLIRRKLGLGEHDRNIDGYIKSLLK